MILVNESEIDAKIIRAPDGEQIIVVSGLTDEKWDALPEAAKDAIIKSVNDDWYYGSPSWLSKLLKAVNEYRDAHSRQESGEVVNMNDPYVQMLIVADEIQKWRDED